MLLDYIFIFVSVLLIASSLVVVLSGHPVIAVLGLIASCVFSAILWLLLEFEFLAVTLILVYVGAVMVLFLFVVMFLDIDVAKEKNSHNKTFPILLLLTALFAAVLFYPYFISGNSPLLQQPLFAELKAEDYSSVQTLGTALFSEAYIQFIVSGMILLTAIIIAISLTLRKRKGNKSIAPAKQVSVAKEDRIRIVKDLQP